MKLYTRSPEKEQRPLEVLRSASGHPGAAEGVAKDRADKVERAFGSLERVVQARLVNRSSEDTHLAAQARGNIESAVAAQTYPTFGSETPPASSYSNHIEEMKAVVDGLQRAA